jgi:hypothetical protein
MIGVAALLLTSCNKNKETVKSIYASGDTYEVVAGEFDEGNGEKIYLEGNKVYFNQGDVVMLFNIKDDDCNQSEYALYEAASTSQTDVTEFTTSGAGLSSIKDAYYAYYPGQRVLPVFNTQTGENYVCFEIPNNQQYQQTNGNGNIPSDCFFMAAKKTTESGNFYFKNIGGFLRLKLWASDNSKKVKNIVVTNNRLNITGKVYLKVDKVDEERLISLFNNYNPDNASYMQTLNSYIQESGYHTENTGNQVWLNCDKDGNDGVSVGTSSATATDFYIALRPAALKYGFTVTVNFTDGTHKDISSNKVDTNIIKPNHIRSMPAIKLW